MPVNPADIDQLLEVLFAGLPNDPVDTDRPRAGCLALAGESRRQGSPSQRFAERSGTATRPAGRGSVAVCTAAVH